MKQPLLDFKRQPTPTQLGFACRMIIVTVLGVLNASTGIAQELPQEESSVDVTPRTLEQSFTILRENCLDCHSGSGHEGNLDLGVLLSRADPTTPDSKVEGQEAVDGAAKPLVSSGFSTAIQPSNLDVWIKIHDRIERGEMPPDGGLAVETRHAVLTPLAQHLVQVDRRVVAATGRATWRRMNRFEYENSLRSLLNAPWLQLASILPADGEVHFFNKPSEALDISHVNMARYLQAADYALREVREYQRLARQKPRLTKTVRYYAREQSSFAGRVHYNEFNRSPERATFPLLDYTADLDVLRDPKTPFTVGKSNPEQREREAFGVVASSYEPIEPRFSEFTAEAAGRYKLRFKGYTFWAGGEDQRWWRADRERVSKGRRSEPVTIYSERPPRQLRRLGEFDFQVEPSVQELDVWLLKGESIQPDAVRLFRSRPPNWHNPLAEPDGVPGVAFNWLEVEGPLFDEEREFNLFGSEHDLDLESDRSEVLVVATDLISKFVARAYRVEDAALIARDAKAFVPVFETALKQGMSFEDALISAYSAVLCSPNYLCFAEQPGHLTEKALQDRLSLFLWNSLSTEVTRRHWEDTSSDHKAENPSSHEIHQRVKEMLQAPQADQFVSAFLDYWLDLRKISDTSPDEFIYPDYYLDDSLFDAALQETRLFFKETLRENLPIKVLIDSDFTFANERLAKHYGFPAFEGALLRKVSIPEGSPRGGLLTQASILKVTANGTTTSPVLRGAWINERILGTHIPPPPPSVPAIEPDTRGATTIREQLEKHKADESCAGCHRQIDPPGFALESFDVVGGYREFYRSMSDEGEALQGFGKNGQPFTFRRGPDVDASGALPDGRTFSNIQEFKQLLLEDQRQIARNFVAKLVTYATGASPRFSDRAEIEAILDSTAAEGYRIRTLIAEVASSRMFLNK